MREIKFRAWGPKSKVMLDWEDVRDELHHFIGHHTYKLMQYTGLTDKNGVEIYEGDVLEDNNYPEDGIFHAVVIWDVEREGWNTKGWGERIEDGVYEVIGNIYENPELLETHE